MHRLLEGYKQIIQSYFPGVAIRSGEHSHDDMTVIDVFFIPDEKMGEFTYFRLNYLCKLIEEYNLPDVVLIAHSKSATQRYYPEVYSDRV